jgi:hypothetical protein
LSETCPNPLRDAGKNLPPELQALVTPMNRTIRLRPELQALADRLPAFVTLHYQAPEIVNRFLFTVSKRTLERWPMPRWKLNGLAHVSTIELLTVADGIIREAGFVLPNYEEPATTAPVAEAAA